MRVFLRFLLGFVIVLAIVWIGLWWYAEGRMQDAVAAWAERIATQGGEVSYDSLKRGTSPATAAIALANVRITEPAGQGRNAVIALPSLGFRISLFNPLLLHVDLPNRIGVEVNGIDAALSFGSVVETQQLDPRALTRREDDPFRGGDFAATDMEVLASQGSLLVLSVEALRGHVAYDRKAGPNGTALNTEVDFSNLSLAPLLTHLLSIPFDGKLAHLAYTQQISGPVPPELAALLRQLNTLPMGDLADRQKLLAPAVNEWARAGGHGGFSLAATVGPTTANADASIKFDANVQPVGDADLTADHLDAFTGALTDAYPQLQGSVAQIEAMLSPYLSSSPQSGQSLAVHVVFGKGTATINGQKAVPLPPLDWNALASPAPAAAP